MVIKSNTRTKCYVCQQQQQHFFCQYTSLTHCDEQITQTIDKIRKPPLVSVISYNSNLMNELSDPICTQTTNIERKIEQIAFECHAYVKPWHIIRGHLKSMAHLGYPIIITGCQYFLFHN